MLETEFARLTAQRAQTPVDTARYELLAPASRDARQDPAAWRAAVDNVHAQLEHQRARALNTELLAKYGPQAWKLAAECVWAPSMLRAGPFVNSSLGAGTSTACRRTLRGGKRRSSAPCRRSTGRASRNKRLRAWLTIRVSHAHQVVCVLGGPQVCQDAAA